MFGMKILSEDQLTQFMLQCEKAEDNIKTRDTEL